MSIVKDKQLMSEFSEFLKLKRQALGLSQAQLAIKIYGNEQRKSYISDIENGRKDISVNSMGIILEALNSWVNFIE